MFNSWSNSLIGFFLVMILIGGSCGNNKTFFSEEAEMDVEVKQYGLFNFKSKSPFVEYRLNWENLIIACVFYESVVAPIYIVGFYLFEPLKLKNEYTPEQLVNSNNKKLELTTTTTIKRKKQEKRWWNK